MVIQLIYETLQSLNNNSNTHFGFRICNVLTYHPLPPLTFRSLNVTGPRKCWTPKILTDWIFWALKNIGHWNYCLSEILTHWKVYFLNILNPESFALFRTTVHRGSIIARDDGWVSISNFYSRQKNRLNFSSAHFETILVSLSSNLP